MGHQGGNHQFARTPEPQGEGIAAIAPAADQQVALIDPPAEMAGNIGAGRQAEMQMTGSHGGLHGWKGGGEFVADAAQSLE